MIERLFIRNLVLVDAAEIHFGEGLNILTGETGAGKSAILSAIRLILGERADTDLIRKGADLAIVEASAMGMEIRRELHRAKPSRCFVNDELVSLSELQERFAGLELVDQGAAYQFSQKEEQRKVLDAYASSNLSPIAAAFDAAQQARSRLEELERSQQESSLESARALEAVQYLESVDWKKGEEEALSLEHNALTRRQELAEKIGSFLSFLSEAPDLRRFAGAMESLDPRLKECADSIYSARAHLEDAERLCASHLESLDANPHRLEEIERRIGQIESVKRRYARTQAECEALLVSLKAQLEQTGNIEERIAAARKNLAASQVQLAALCRDLTGKRRAAAQSLEEKVLHELQELNLGAARLQIGLEEKAPSPNGADEICWLFSANPGQPLLPLERCASGGELSRLLLAVKIALAGKLGAKALIFDEIDGNVGGVTAAILGAKLKQLASSCQIICVSHFVQVAKFAARHFLVSKQEALTRLTELDEAGKAAEYNRMTGILD